MLCLILFTYLFIYLRKKYGLRKKRTMRMFLSNPNVNRLSINSKLENFPRRTRFWPQKLYFCHQKAYVSGPWIPGWAYWKYSSGNWIGRSWPSMKSWLEVVSVISRISYLNLDLSFIISGLLCEWNHFRFGAIEVLKSKRLWQV